MPAKKRIRSSIKATLSSNVLNGGSDYEETEENTRDSVLEQKEKFGPWISFTSARFETQRMRLNTSVHDQNQQMRENQPVQDHEFSVAVVNQMQISTSTWNKSQMPGPSSFYPSAIPSSIPPDAQQLLGRLMMIDAEIGHLFNNCPPAHNNLEEWHRIQHQVAVLSREREY